MKTTKQSRKKAIKRFQTFLSGMGTALISESEKKGDCYSGGDISKLLNVNKTCVKKILDRCGIEQICRGRWLKDLVDEIVEVYKISRSGGPSSNYISKEWAAFALNIDLDDVEGFLENHEVKTDKNGIVRESFEYTVVRKFKNDCDVVLFRLGYNGYQVRRIKKIYEIGYTPKISVEEIEEKPRGKLDEYKFNEKYTKKEFERLGKNLYLSGATMSTVKSSFLFCREENEAYGVEIARMLYNRNLRADFAKFNYPSGVANSNWEIRLHEEQIQKETGEKTRNCNY